MPMERNSEDLVKKAWAAARSGDALGLREALEAGVDANERNKMGRTLLMQAAISGYEGCVDVLRGRAESSFVDSFGNTALMLAASHGHDACARALIPWSSMEASCRREGWTAIACALFEGHLSTAEILAQAGASLAARDKLGRTLAMGIAREAAAAERMSALAWLARTDPDWALGADSDRRRDFMMACVMAHSQECARMAIGKCDPSARDIDGNTALILAARFAPTLVEILAPLSSMVDADAEGMTALMWAADSGAMEKLAPILDRCSIEDIDLVSKARGGALDIALKGGHEGAAHAIQARRGALEREALRLAVGQVDLASQGAQRL